MANPAIPADLATDAFPASSGSQRISLSDKKRLAITTASLLLGGGAALAIMLNRTDTEKTAGPGLPPVAEPPTPTEQTGDPDSELNTWLNKEGVTAPPKADVANNIHDGMSFAEAFAEAREAVGPGGVFIWKDQAYNTFFKEEWTDLSVQQRIEYAEHVLDAALPVAPFQPVAHKTGMPPQTAPGQTTVTPTIMEGTLNDRRVMGIDQDNDGVIDLLVIDGEDGYLYSVADRTGNEGLDTIYAYDTLRDEYVLAAKLDEPVVLSNAAFSASLEDSLSREAVGAIMEPTAQAADLDEVDDDLEGDDQPDEPTANEPEPDQPEESFEENGYGDTYVNNANVSDMDDPHQ